MTDTQNITAAASALLVKLAAMAPKGYGKGASEFICTEMLSKRENGTLTGLKKKGLLSTSVSKAADKSSLLICFTEAGLELVAKLTAPVAEEAPAAAEEEAPAVEAVEEAPAAPEEAAAEAVEETPSAPEEAPAAEAVEEAPAKKGKGRPRKEKAEKKPKTAEEIAEARMRGVMALFSPLPPAGTVLETEYKGKKYKAILRENGACEFGGTTYISLSAAARAITGRKVVSGRKFFKVPSRLLVGPNAQA